MNSFFYYNTTSNLLHITFILYNHFNRISLTKWFHFNRIPFFSNKHSCVHYISCLKYTSTFLTATYYTFNFLSYWAWSWYLKKRGNKLLNILTPSIAKFSLWYLSKTFEGFLSNHLIISIDFQWLLNIYNQFDKQVCFILQINLTYSF